MNDRFYNKERVDINNINLNNIIMSVDSDAWKRPRTLSLEQINNVLQISFNDLKDKNVTSVEFNNQDKYPSIKPTNFKIIEKSYIALDDNYLYVWIPNLNKWKRIILSDF